MTPDPVSFDPATITAIGGIVATVIAGIVSVSVAIVQATSAGRRAGEAAGQEAGKAAGQEAGSSAGDMAVDKSSVIIDLAEKITDLDIKSQEQRRLIDDQAGKLDHLTVITLERDEAISKNRIAKLRIDELNRKIGQLNAELLSIRVRTGEDAAHYQERISVLERERDDLERRVAVLERERGEVDKRIAELEIECEDLRGRLLKTDDEQA